MNGNRFLLQDSQYTFPYHYLPHFDARGVPRRVRYLKWGFEYLCYQMHLIEVALGEPIKSALEVGCGDGFFIGALGPAVQTRVGVDLSEAAIRFARAFHPDVRFDVCPVVDVAGQFELVVLAEVLEHIPDEQAASFLATVWDKVAPGGRMLLSVPTKAVPCHPKHFRHYDIALLKSSLSEAGIDAPFESYDFIYGPPRTIEAFLKVTCNRLLAIELSLVNTWLWRYLWRTRRASETRGRHLVAVIRRGDKIRS